MAVTNEQWKNLADFISMYVRMRKLHGRIQYHPFDENDSMRITIEGKSEILGTMYRDYVICRRETDDIYKAAAIIADRIDNPGDGWRSRTEDMDIPSLYPKGSMIERYMRNDYSVTKALVNQCLGVKKNGVEITYAHPEEHLIEDVIFNDPATIVFWADGTKTVVKADKEDFDPEKGLAMAISKKVLGNKGNYFDIFKKWMANYKKPQSTFSEAWRRASMRVHEFAENMAMKNTHPAAWLAEQRLQNALHDKKATKADLRAAMEEAIKYLSNEKEN